MKKMKPIISALEIEPLIYWIRGQKVMLDRDLARLYGVEVRALIQAIKRNQDRFPKDFMFQLSWKEIEFSRSQIVILKRRRGRNIKYLPYAFTEQGIAMLSGVLKSKQAIRVNIAIMRAFVKLRRLLSSHRKLAAKLVELERKLETHDHEIQSIFQVIRQIMAPAEKPKKQIGFISQA